MEATWRTSSYRNHHAPSRYGPSLGDWEYATDFLLTNRSDATCVLSGWAGFTMLGDAAVCVTVVGQDETSCDPPARDDIIPQQVIDDPGPAETVLLRAGGGIAFSALWRLGTCLRQPYAVRLTIPGTDRVIAILPMSGSSLCAEEPVHITALGHPVA